MQLRHATHADRRNSEVSTFIISYGNQPAKLDKFQSQCYSKCSKWRPLVSMQQCRCLHHWWTALSIAVAENRETVVGYQYQATRVGAHRLK